MRYRRRQLAQPWRKNQIACRQDQSAIGGLGERRMKLDPLRRS
jgi:hypothetical protein